MNLFIFFFYRSPIDERKNIETSVSDHRELLNVNPIVEPRCHVRRSTEDTSHVRQVETFRRGVRGFLGEPSCTWKDRSWVLFFSCFSCSDPCLFPCSEPKMGFFNFFFFFRLCILVLFLCLEEATYSRHDTVNKIRSRRHNLRSLFELLLICGR